MDATYVTLVGFGSETGGKAFRDGLPVLLVKEPENEYDGEAIRVELPGVGRIGYVANSTSTVARGTASAGRAYDTFGKACFATILFVVRGTAIARLEPGLKKLVWSVELVGEETMGRQGVGSERVGNEAGKREKTGLPRPTDPEKAGFGNREHYQA